MPVLYHHPMSTASRFVRLIFAEYGFHADLVEEQPWEKRRDFIALNPAGTLPVYLDDNMRTLCGATIISEFMDETSGVLKRDRRLLAEDPFQRAEIRRLTEWFLQNMEQDVIKPLVRERVFKLHMSADQGGGAPDSKVLRTARSNIRQHLRYLTWLAGSRPWLAGDRLSYADLCAGAAISVLDYLGEVDWTEWVQIKEWYQRLKSRPSFRALLTDRVRSVTPVPHYADLDF
jgi:glutathione S-transferase